MAFTTPSPRALVGHFVLYKCWGSGISLLPVYLTESIQFPTTSSEKSKAVSHQSKIREFEGLSIPIFFSIRIKCVQEHIT